NSKNARIYTSLPDGGFEPNSSLPAVADGAGSPRPRGGGPRLVGGRPDLRAAAGKERGRPCVLVHRRPGDGEQVPRRPYGLGQDAEGRLPALQGAPGLRPALPERLRLPGPLDRG